VRREMKERLEKLKGEREWSEFLNDLIDEVIKVRRKESFRKLRELSLEHLESIEESHKRFRREFSLDPH